MSEDIGLRIVFGIFLVGWFFWELYKMNRAEEKAIARSIEQYE